MVTSATMPSAPCPGIRSTPVGPDGKALCPVCRRRFSATSAGYLRPHQGRSAAPLSADNAQAGERDA